MVVVFRMVFDGLLWSFFFGGGGDVIVSFVILIVGCGVWKPLQRVSGFLGL